MTRFRPSRAVNASIDPFPVNRGAMNLILTSYLASEPESDSGLTELRIVVPWRPLGESRERTTLAASNFAAVLTDQLQAA